MHRRYARHDASVSFADRAAPTLCEIFRFVLQGRPAGLGCGALRLWCAYALALGRDETALYQCWDAAASAGSANFSHLAKSTTTMAMMSAAV